MLEQACNEQYDYLQHINHNMSIFDLLVGVIAPHECLGCGAEGAIACKDCLNTIPIAARQCYKCLTPSENGFTCEKCLPSAPLAQVQSVTVYAGLAKDLLWSLKANNAQAAAKPMAKAMLQLTDTDVILVPVPTATSRVRQRGYDQAVLLARELARQIQNPLVKALARTGHTHQVGAPRSQRLSQLAGAYYIRSTKPVQNKHVLLIDDVMTTGATLEAAAKALLQAGAQRVDALTFARA